MIDWIKELFLKNNKNTTDDHFQIAREYWFPSPNHRVYKIQKIIDKIKLKQIKI
jgi:hypothetical protein